MNDVKIFALYVAGKIETGCECQPTKNFLPPPVDFQISLIAIS